MPPRAVSPSLRIKSAPVAVGWQVYALTGSALALGLVGLVQFLPSALLVFAAGHVADRYNRQRVVQICQIAEAVTAAFLAWGTLGGWLSVAEIFAAMAVFGVAIAFESPAAAALLPGVGTGRPDAAGHGGLHRCLAGGDDQRSGAGRPGVRRRPRRALRGDGGLLAVVGTHGRSDHT